MLRAYHCQASTADRSGGQQRGVGRSKERCAAYDYIIVSAGAAGRVLANRLSADPTVPVLLVDAGGRDIDPLFDKHGMHDWGYFAEPNLALGGSGWSYNEVLPYFRPSETWEGGASETRGGADPLFGAWRAAAKATCYPIVDDAASGTTESFVRSRFTIGKSRWSSAAVAYLKPVCKHGGRDRSSSWKQWRIDDPVV